MKQEELPERRKRALDKIADTEVELRELADSDVKCGWIAETLLEILDEERERGRYNG